MKLLLLAGLLLGAWKLVIRMRRNEDTVSPATRDRLVLADEAQTRTRDLLEMQPARRQASEGPTTRAHSKVGIR